MFTENSQNETKIFKCVQCNYTCFRKNDYTKHLSTRKHRNVYQMFTQNSQNSQDDNVSVKTGKTHGITVTQITCGKHTNKNSQIMRQNSHKAFPVTQIENNHFICICGKEYKHKQSLYVHKKECTLYKNTLNMNVTCNENMYLTNLVLEVIKNNNELQKQNNELQKQIIEISKDKSNTTHIIHNTNSHNKTFNLQVFLNETCKDAMNISEFIESLQIQVSDLENVGRVGYVDGIADIIVKNLKALDVSKRPVHCTDLKREILYVKDEDKWEKDNIDKDKLRKAIKHIAHKNIKMIPAWKELNPAYVLDEGKSNDEYIQIIMKSMGGSDKAQDISYENKIISKLARCVAIDKDGIVL